MIIDIGLLETGKIKEIKFDRVLNGAENPFLDAGIDFIDGVAIKYKVDIADGDFIVTGSFKAAISLVCDKCGVKYKYQLNDKFIYILVNEIPEDLTESDDLILIDKTRKADITEKLRESILISMPFSNKCRADCKGLCFNCGADLNTTNCNCSSEDTNPAFDKILNLLDD